MCIYTQSSIECIAHAQVRKDTRLSPLFCNTNDEKLGGAWEWGYVHVCVCDSLPHLWMHNSESITQIPLQLQFKAVINHIEGQVTRLQGIIDALRGYIHPE